MSEQESIKREYDTLAASLKEARELREQFPGDWTLSMHISRAEYRLQTLQFMQGQAQQAQYRAVSASQQMKQAQRSSTLGHFDRQ